MGRIGRALGLCLLIGAAADPDAALAAEATEEAPADGGAAAAPDAEAPRLLDALRPKARLLLGIKSQEDEAWARRYGVRQARLGVRLREGLFRVELEADLAESSILNDAWIEVRATDALRFRIGRFKEPFGRFRLASAWSLPLLARPAFTDAAEELGFGGRDLGATVAWELLFFEIAAGAFQGTGVGAEAPQETGFLRLTATPFAFLELGTSLARRAVFDGGDGNAVGFDAKVQAWGFTLLAEWQEASHHGRALLERGAGVLLARRFPLDDRVWLEPAVGVERLDGRGDGGAAAMGLGVGDRFVARVGARRAPRRDGDPPSTEATLQLGVQL